MKFNWKVELQNGMTFICNDIEMIGKLNREETPTNAKWQSISQSSFPK